jgi:hypothetical protein
MATVKKKGEEWPPSHQPHRARYGGERGGQRGEEGRDAVSREGRNRGPAEQLEGAEVALVVHVLVRDPAADNFLVTWLRSPAAAPLHP